MGSNEKGALKYYALLETGWVSAYVSVERFRFRTVHDSFPSHSSLERLPNPYSRIKGFKWISRNKFLYRDNVDAIIVDLDIHSYPF